MDERERLASRLALHSMDSPYAIGLFGGQMGVLIVLAEYARKYDVSGFERVADILFENISRQIGDSSPIGFANGLAGIGWGVEYLVSRDIMPGPADEICRGLDDIIMRYDLKRMEDLSFETGFAGVDCYIQARIKGNEQAGLPMPFDADYLNERLAVVSSGKITEVVSGPTVSELITRQTNYNLHNLGLVGGLAGYIATTYLNL